MPAPLLAAGIAAGASLLGTGGQIYAQGKMNKKTRKWNEKMYGVQRKDALSDWEMQNAYNSPAAQMQRLKDAGLNPNLVYGNGAEATSGSMPRNSSAGNWSPETPPISQIGNAAQRGLDAYFDVQARSAQIDNLQTQNDVMKWDALVKAANVDNIAADTALKSFGLKKGESMLNYNLDMAREQLVGLMQRNLIMLNQDERAALQTSQSLKESAERILSMRLNRAKTAADIDQVRQTISNLKNSNILQQLDINLKKLGIQPGDNLAARIIGQLLNNPQKMEKAGSELFGGSSADSWLDRILGRYSKKPW